MVRACRAVGGEATGRFVEVTLGILNGDSCPAHTDEETARCLTAFADTFRNAESAALMYTNDTHVLTDIILRELTNLPDGSTLLARYVEVLHLLLLNSSWREEKRKREEVAEVLEALERAGGGGEGGGECGKALGDLMKDCGACGTLLFSFSFAAPIHRT